MLLRGGNLKTCFLLLPQPVVHFCQPGFKLRRRRLRCRPRLRRKTLQFFGVFGKQAIANSVELHCVRFLRQLSLFRKLSPRRLVGLRQHLRAVRFESGQSSLVLTARLPQFALVSLDDTFVFFGQVRHASRLRGLDGFQRRFVSLVTQ